MDILLKSIIGGIIIALVLVLSRLFGERVGSIFASMPLVFILSFIFVTVEQKNKSQILSFLEGGAWGIVFFVLSILVLYFLSIYSDRYWLNIFVVYLVWFAGMGIWVYFFKK